MPAQCYPICAKNKEIAQVYVLVDSPVVPDGEHQFSHMVSLLDQLPMDLKQVWLVGRRAEVLEDAVFENMFSGVKDWEHLQLLSFDIPKLIDTLTPVVHGIIQAIPSSEPH